LALGDDGEMISGIKQFLGGVNQLISKRTEKDASKGFFNI
jgi:hypothetical protein